MNPVQVQQIINDRNQLMQKLKSLQNQLTMVQNNPPAYQQVMQYINQTNQALQQIEPMYQQIMMQQQQMQNGMVQNNMMQNNMGYQQNVNVGGAGNMMPNTGYQQPVQNYGYQQPVQTTSNKQEYFQNMNASIGRANANVNTNGMYGGVVQEESDVDVRFGSGRRKTTPIQSHRVYQQEETQVTETPTQQEQVELLPLPGNEFPLLVASGIVAEREINGNYFKYSLKGRLNMEEYKNDRFEFKKLELKNRLRTGIEADEFVKQKLELLARENDRLNVGVDNVTVIPVLSDKENADDVYIELIKSSKDLLALASNVESLQDDYGNLITEIDKRITKRLNEHLKFRAISQAGVDSFLEDIQELVELVNGLEDLTMKQKFITVIEDFQKTLKYDVEDINIEDYKIELDIESDKFKLIPIVEKTSILLLNSYKIKYDIIEQVSQNKTMLVTPVSHQLLYNVLADAYENMEHFRRTNECLLYVVSGNNAPHEKFKLFKSVENSFVITLGD